MIRFRCRSLLLVLLLPCLLFFSLSVPETRGEEKAVVGKSDIESLLRMIAQTAGNIEGVNDIVNSAMCAPPVVEPKMEGAECEDADSAASLNRQNLDKFRLCLASLQVALAGGGQGGNRPLPSNRQCLDVTGNYSCSGREVYIDFSKGADGGFILDMELESGKYYQYKADDQLNIGNEKKIASCRRKFVKIAFPTEGRDRYKVQEYTLDHRRDLEVDIYIVEAPGGNMNNAKRIENKNFFTCSKI